MLSVRMGSLVEPFVVLAGDFATTFRLTVTSAQ